MFCWIFRVPHIIELLVLLPPVQLITCLLQYKGIICIQGILLTVSSSGVGKRSYLSH